MFIVNTTQAAVGGDSPVRYPLYIGLYSESFLRDRALWHLLKLIAGENSG